MGIRSPNLQGDARHRSRGYPIAAFAQAGFDDDRVMLQGFTRKSSGRQPEVPAVRRNREWYDIVRDNVGVIREGRFDLSGSPRPARRGGAPATTRSSTGSSTTATELRPAPGDAGGLLGKGVEPVADIVINHRDGTDKWADFKNPDWGTKTICRSDEAFTNDGSEVKGTPGQSGGPTRRRPMSTPPSGGLTATAISATSTTRNPSRSAATSSGTSSSSKSAGYRGWRYDMVHGYHAKRLALYNKRTSRRFRSANTTGTSTANSAAGSTRRRSRDVPARSTCRHRAACSTSPRSSPCKDNKGNYRNWYVFDNGLGMMGDTTDGLPWKQRAVTFLENHDTGYRTDEDGNPQKDHETDSFLNGWEVEQGYAYILTHPGVPCVYWKHYFDWGSEAAGADQGAGQCPQGGGRPRGQPAVRPGQRQGRRVYTRPGWSARAAISTSASAELMRTSSRRPRATRTTGSMRRERDGKCGSACRAIRA